MTIGTQHHCEAVHSLIYHPAEQQMCEGVSEMEFSFRPWDLIFQIYIKIYIITSIASQPHLMKKGPILFACHVEKSGVFFLNVLFNCFTGISVIFM